jgi:hypothetical protein
MEAVVDELFGTGLQEQWWHDALATAKSGFNKTTLGARSTGVTGGAQAGYNWQIGSLVTGVEADIQGSGIKASANAAPTSPF